MSKQSYHEGWGYSDTVKLLIKGTQANRDAFYKELKVTFPTDDIEKVGGTSIEAFVYERQIPVVKKMATVFKMKIAYEGGGKTGDIEIAKIILDQLGGQRRLVVMTGANNFIAVKNGLSFKLKSRIANYVKIVLNGNDLYDIEFQKLIGTKSKKVAEYNDIYFDQLIPIVEKETGMYLKLFKKGGFVSTQNRDMVLSQLKSIHHHEEELRSALKTSPEIEAWVLAKVQRATTDLSDVTHYLDGRTEYKTGGDIKPFETKTNGSTIYINGTQADVKKMYLDFVNNFLTIGSFADYYNISEKQASLIIESGRGYEEFAEGGVAQGFSVADANPYIAGAKAVQGIAPHSVSAIDQRLARKFNPDPNRPVFFAVGGKVGDYVQFKGVDDEIRTGIITEDLGGDNYAVSSGFGQVLVNSDNYIGKTTKPAERKRFLGIFNEGGQISTQGFKVGDVLIAEYNWSQIPKPKYEVLEILGLEAPSFSGKYRNKLRLKDLQTGEEFIGNEGRYSH